MMTDTPQVPAILQGQDIDRSTYIGSSDIAGIMGLQPKGWRTAVQIWQRKIATTPEPESDAAKRKRYARGHVVEPLVGNLLLALYDIKADVRNRRIVDPDVPYFAAEIDIELPFGAVRHLFPVDLLVDRLGEAAAYAIPDDEIVNGEIKTVHPFNISEWGEEGSEDVPVHYGCQINWGLGVTRRRLALCAALFGADQLVLYPMVIDVGPLDKMIAAGRFFWEECVLTREPPSAQTLNDCKLLWPTDNGKPIDIAGDSELWAFLKTMKGLKKRHTMLENTKDGIDVHIREMIGDAETVTMGSAVLATLKSQSQERIDEDKLKREYPKAWRACRRTIDFRVLRIPDKAPL